MAGMWDKWNEPAKQETPWQYEPERKDRYWMKRFLTAAIAFLVFYTAHASDSKVGRMLDTSVIYVLSQQVELGGWAEKLLAACQSLWPLPAAPEVPTTANPAVAEPSRLLWPVTGKTLKYYGKQPDTGDMFSGVEIETVAGAAVKAATAGKIRLIADGVPNGKMLVIEGGRGTDIIYRGLGEVLVKASDSVSAGQLVARAAATRLYVEVQERGMAINPLERFEQQPTAPVRK